jgi:hypothetical protein
MNWTSDEGALSALILAACCVESAVPAVLLLAVSGPVLVLERVPKLQIGLADVAHVLAVELWLRARMEKDRHRADHGQMHRPPKHLTS